MSLSKHHPNSENLHSYHTSTLFCEHSPTPEQRAFIPPPPSSHANSWLFAGTAATTGPGGVVNGVVRVWHMDNGFEQTLEGHQGSIFTLAQGGAYLFSGGDDMGVKTWQASRSRACVACSAHTQHSELRSPPPRILPKRGALTPSPARPHSQAPRSAAHTSFDHPVDGSTKSIADDRQRNPARVSQRTYSYTTTI